MNSEKNVSRLQNIIRSGEPEGGNGLRTKNNAGSGAPSLCLRTIFSVLITVACAGVIVAQPCQILRELPLNDGVRFLPFPAQQLCQVLLPPCPKSIE